MPLAYLKPLPIHASALNIALPSSATNTRTRARREERGAHQQNDRQGTYVCAHSAEVDGFDDAQCVTERQPAKRKAAKVVDASVALMVRSRESLRSPRDGLEVRIQNSSARHADDCTRRDQ